MIFQRIRNLREDSDLTQKQVAEMLNMHISVYRRYEYGQREIPAWALIQLAQFYQTTADYILELSNQR